MHLQDSTKRARTMQSIGIHRRGEVGRCNARRLEVKARRRSWIGDSQNLEGGIGYGISLLERQIDSTFQTKATTGAGNSDRSETQLWILMTKVRAFFFRCPLWYPERGRRELYIDSPLLFPNLKLIVITNNTHQMVVVSVMSLRYRKIIPYSCSVLTSKSLQKPCRNRSTEVLREGV